MPFAPGTPKPANSGRKRGQGNKATVAAKLASMKCDPIEGMAKIAMDVKNAPQLRGRMYAELAQYCHPRLRSIEVSGPGGAPIEVANVSPAELLLSRINSIAVRRGTGGGNQRTDG